ncbi:hypothetical protein PCASD_11914 [Puccinia coronata f. sp. avenae]|uniref:Alpha-galactosidase n=1 Tax=Puccinia coronata f. sp. avenae TaxID=200324 RepID=A0A2N5TD25_9BASI|nr:hypothetical protein PCASD_11914 [Puccinia coronata f. sp. avenae]
MKWAGGLIFTISTIGFTTQTPITQVGFTSQATINHVSRRGPKAPAGPKPAMGWNSFWPLGCGKQVKEDNLSKQAGLLVEKGLNKAGYTTVIIECGWEDWPSSDGSPNIKESAFSEGIDRFSDDLNSKGLRLGLGTWAGNQLCKRNPHEKFHGGDIPKDLKRYVSTLADRGMMYLSHRPCDLASPNRLQDPNQAKELNSRYIQMEDAIHDSGKEIFYATGQWGASPDVNRQLQANSWKVADDTRDNWNSLIRTMNALAPFAPKAGPGSFIDLGLLQLGNNKMTDPEKITQFTFWAAAKSPLIFSTDLSQLDQYYTDILTRPEIISINQDDLGKSITLNRRYSGEKDIWSAPLSDGSTVAVIVNWENQVAQKSIKMSDLGFSSARVTDIWTGKDYGTFNDTVQYSQYSGPHGSLLLKLTETKPAPKRNLKRFPAEVADAMGSARLKDVNPKAKAISMISPNGGGGVRWNNIPGGPAKGDVLVSIDFINADLATGDGDDSKLNFKRTVFTINDTDKVYVDFPISGLLWEDVYEGFLVSLPLNPGDNRVLIEGVDDWAPDFVCLSVEQTADQQPSSS